MHSSARFRLSAWYVGILALLLSSCIFSLYVLLERSLQTNLDSDLRQVMEVAALSLRHETEEHKGKLPGENEFRDVLGQIFPKSFARQSIAVYEGNRLVAQRIGEIGMVPPPPLPAAERFHLSRMEQDQLRVASLKVNVAYSGTNYIFVAVDSEVPMRKELAVFKHVFLLAVPLLIALAGCGGFLLVRKALAPVGEMAAAIGRIGSRDLTQRLEVLNPRDEFGLLATTVNGLLERVEIGFSQQRNFMADASHELRTPISIAQTAVQVHLQGGPRDAAEYTDALTVIEQQLLRLARVVDDMFRLARADSGVYPLRTTAVYLEELLQDAVRAVRVLAEGKGITVAFPTACEAPFEGDAGLLRQLFLILLDNAVKYTQSGGRVDVVLTAAPDGYKIEVRDNGPGIPEEYSGRVFERFFRGERARSRVTADHGGGAGLGLSIGKWIAETHGGRLDFRNLRPAGASFTVHLPANSRDAQTLT